MQPEALLATTRRADELRYVTQHFRGLQGLRMAPIWGSTLIFAVLPTSVAPYELRYLLPLCAGYAVFWGACLLLVPHWYRRHYGFLAQTPGVHYHQAVLLASIWALAVIFIIGLYIALGSAGQFIRFVTGGMLNASMAGLYMLQACEQLPAIPSVQARRVISLAVVGAALSGILRAFLGGAPGGLLFLPTETAMFFACLYDHWLLQHLLTNSTRSEMSYD